jgi:hypothetical protein
MNKDSQMECTSTGHVDLHKGVPMEIRALGKYYVWYCERCGYRNLTVWMRFLKGSARCGACCCRMEVPGLALCDGDRWSPAGRGLRSA